MTIAPECAQGISSLSQLRYHITHVYLDGVARELYTSFDIYMETPYT